MKIFQASLFISVLLAYHRVFPNRRVNVLRSFGIPSPEDNQFMTTHREKVGCLALDSGTWTLNNPKKKPTIHINVYSYRSYLMSFGHAYDIYFNFDANFTREGFVQNLCNQHILEDAGLEPVPVIHNIYGEEVDYYIDSGYPIVAIGSAEVTKKDEIEDVVWKLYGAGIKIHLFGTTKYDIISTLPVYSCDSSSWEKMGTHGYIAFWNPHRSGQNKTDKIYLEEYIPPDDQDKGILYSTYEYRSEFDTYLADTFNLEYRDFLIKNGALKKMLVNMHYFLEQERRTTEEHRKRGYKTED